MLRCKLSETASICDSPSPISPQKSIGITTIAKLIYVRSATVSTGRQELKELFSNMFRTFLSMVRVGKVPFYVRGPLMDVTNKASSSPYFDPLLNKEVRVCILKDKFKVQMIFQGYLTDSLEISLVLFIRSSRFQPFAVLPHSCFARPMNYGKPG